MNKEKMKKHNAYKGIFIIAIGYFVSFVFKKVLEESYGYYDVDNIVNYKSIIFACSMAILGGLNTICIWGTYKSISSKKIVANDYVKQPENKNGLRKERDTVLVCISSPFDILYSEKNKKNTNIMLLISVIAVFAVSMVLMYCTKSIALVIENGILDFLSSVSVIMFFVNSQVEHDICKKIVGK